jgi:hypothetical protein
MCHRRCSVDVSLFNVDNEECALFAPDVQQVRQFQEKASCQCTCLFGVQFCVTDDDAAQVVAEYQRVEQLAAGRFKILRFTFELWSSSASFGKSDVLA